MVLSLHLLAQLSAFGGSKLCTHGSFSPQYSSVDLEHDLVMSNLFSSLKSYYNTRTETSTVKKMQQAKAENMLSFLSNKFDTLDCLKEDKIAEPLKRIKALAEMVVSLNE